MLWWKWDSFNDGLSPLKVVILIARSHRSYKTVPFSHLLRTRLKAQSRDGFTALLTFIATNGLVALVLSALDHKTSYFWQPKSVPRKKNNPMNKLTWGGSIWISGAKDPGWQTVIEGYRGFGILFVFGLGLIRLQDLFNGKLQTFGPNVAEGWLIWFHVPRISLPNWRHMTDQGEWDRCQCQWSLTSCSMLMTRKQDCYLLNLVANWVAQESKRKELACPRWKT